MTLTDPNATLTVTKTEGGGLTMANMPNPLESAEKIGNWLHQAGMVKTPGAASIMALTAISRGTDLMQFVSEHSVVDGKVTRKYELLLSDLRDCGEDFRWLKTGENREAAELEWTWKGKTYRYEFTTEMAAQAGLIDESKKRSNWVAWRPNMLRSKCVRQGFTMYCPELLRGITTPEDAADVAQVIEVQSGGSLPSENLAGGGGSESAGSESSRPQGSTEVKPEAAAGNRQGEKPVAGRPVVATPEGDVDDSLAAAEAHERQQLDRASGSNSSNTKVSNQQLVRIVELAGQITNTATGKPFTVDEIATQIEAAQGCKPNDLTAAKADEFIGLLEKTVQSAVDAEEVPY